MATPPDPFVQRRIEASLMHGIGSQCRGGPAFRPLEPASKSRTETPRSRYRARADDRPLPRHRAVRWHAVGGYPFIRRGLHHRDVRDRFDYCDTPVRPVFHSALPSHSRDREWISLFCVSDRPVCPRVSRRVGAKRRSRRLADDRAPVPSMALRVPVICHWLCLVEGRGPQQTVFARGGQFSDLPERRLDCCRRGGSHVCVHKERSRRRSVAAHHARSSIASSRSGLMWSARPSLRCALSRSSCSGFGDGRFSISS